MKLSRRLGILTALALPTGFFLCFVPWGNPNEFHGTGVPIPTVMWDRTESSDGKLVDFPYPPAFVLNPLIVLIVFLLFYGIGSLTFLIFKKLRSHHSSSGVTP